MIKVNLRNNLNGTSAIIDENTTLRDALEQAGIDYASGMTSLDGVTLQPGDIDKTFADFGVTDRCYLCVVAKAQNAAAIKVVGGVAVIESGAALETIKKVSKYRPNALKLFEGTGANKEEVFVVGAAKAGLGAINQYGASFGTATTADGNATITIAIPEGCDDPKGFVMDKVGVAILNLNKVEAQLAGAIDEIDTEMDAIEANITVM